MDIKQFEFEFQLLRLILADGVNAHKSIADVKEEYKAYLELITKVKVDSSRT